MDARRLVAFGGGIAAAVGVTVACTFAVSSAVELTDVAGESITASPVVVPSASATPTASPSSAPTVQPTVKPTAETVPAPEPRAVTPQTHKPGKADSGSKGTKASQSPKPHRTHTPTPSPDRRDGSDVVAQYQKDGDWSKVVAWADAQGWSKEKTSRWLHWVHETCDRGDDRRDDDGGRRGGTETSSSRTTETPTSVGTVSGHDLPREWSG